MEFIWLERVDEAVAAALEPQRETKAQSLHDADAPALTGA